MTISSKPLIGLSGTFASGKDTLAHYLVHQHDYYHISTSDMVRAVAMERYGNTERPMLQKTGNELRNDRGAGVLVELAMESYLQNKEIYKGLVISGIRSIGEVQAIKQAGGTMVFIDAPIKQRYQRAVDRKRANEDLLDFEAFVASEEAEMNVIPTAKDIFVQNLTAVKALADTEIINDATVTDFLERSKRDLALVG